jgi:hypothetical protein
VNAEIRIFLIGLSFSLSFLSACTSDRRTDLVIGSYRADVASHLFCIACIAQPCAINSRGLGWRRHPRAALSFVCVAEEHASDVTQVTPRNNSSIPKMMWKAIQPALVIGSDYAGLPDRSRR